MASSTEVVWKTICALPHAYPSASTPPVSSSDSEPASASLANSASARSSGMTSSRSAHGAM
jgi:hypothetical protein